MKIIKYGGHVLDDADTNDAIIRAIADLHQQGEKIVVVHGGGPAINNELAIHGIPSEMVGGYRKTSPEAMEIVQQALAGSVLRALTNSFIACGVNAVGISAADGQIIRAEKFQPTINGEILDIGLVGEPTQVDVSLLHLLLDAGYLPIISPIGVDISGQALNINGDIAAGAIAGALQAEEVLFITDVAGIYRSWPDLSSIIEEISREELAAIAETFADGMAPKVRAVLSGLESGAKRARIIDGTDLKNLKSSLSGVGGTVVFA
jgi:acetylglutamate kinase